MENRKYNYELLRILSMIAVITIHVSASYVGAITSDRWLDVLYTEHVFYSCLFNVLSRFAVPCFVMLSGAFALDSEKNAQYLYYYKKVFRRIGIPTIIFSILYFLYGILRQVAAIFIKGRPATGIVGVILSAIKGAPFYHMWYLYMMAGVFLLVPFVIKFKNEVGWKIFRRVAVVFFVTAILGMWTSRHKLYWDPGYSFCYLGYFMMGYVIRKSIKTEEKNWKAILFVLGGICVLVLVACLRYVQAGYGIEDKDLKYGLVGPNNPLIAAASLLIFTGFSKLNFHKDVTKLSRLAFLIYLIHAGVWDILSRFVTDKMDNRIVMPLGIAVVFFLSLALAVIYTGLMGAVEKKWALSDKICISLLNQLVKVIKM